MRKLLFILLTVISIAVNAQQMNFKGIQINHAITYQDETLTGCYIITRDMYICEGIKSLRASATISIYKTKAIATAHPTWQIVVSNIPADYNDLSNVMLPLSIGSMFTEGDLSTKILEAIKLTILIANPTWNPNDIIIEQ